jgi:hypothetical protein
MPDLGLGKSRTYPKTGLFRPFSPQNAPEMPYLGNRGNLPLTRFCPDPVDLNRAIFLLPKTHWGI